MRLIKISVVSGAAILMLGCAAWVAADTEPDIYYKSQKDADAALAQFDKDNPDCQLWTNWQKICAKTGTGYNSFCAKDAKHKAAPSVPFCVVKNFRINSQPRVRSDLEGISAFRFCKKRKLTSINYEGRQVSGEYCIQFSEKRPFSFENRSPSNMVLIFKKELHKCQELTTTKTGGGEWPLSLGPDEIDTRASVNLKIVPVFGAYCHKFAE